MVGRPSLRNEGSRHFAEARKDVKIAARSSLFYSIPFSARSEAAFHLVLNRRPFIFRPPSTYTVRTYVRHYTHCRRVNTERYNHRQPPATNQRPLFHLQRALIFLLLLPRCSSLSLSLLLPLFPRRQVGDLRRYRRQGKRDDGKWRTKSTTSNL